MNCYAPVLVAFIVAASIFFAPSAVCAAPRYTPVVLMHGIADTNASMAHMKHLIEQKLPGVYVRALEITTYDGSIFTGIDLQVEMACKALAADPNLAGGFNSIGVSQGAILMRGYLERCNQPKVKNFISWVSPQMGVYGVPNWGSWEYLNVTLDDIADCCIYDEWAQDVFSFAGYWRDPFALAEYVQRKIFLSDINNEREEKNPIYKQRILDLESFVMSYSTIDEVLIPRETGWFGAFANNSVASVVPLDEQPMYKYDWIGLRTLHETGRLHRFTTSCVHNDYAGPCFEQYFIPNVLPILLNSTIPN
jgi:palmitoyl-protein thioesterase